jgi:hypothetical protein
VNEDKEEKEWRLDVKEEDIHNVTYINLDEIENDIDVEEIVKK